MRLAIFTNLYTSACIVLSWSELGTLFETSRNFEWQAVFHYQWKSTQTWLTNSTYLIFRTPHAFMLFSKRTSVCSPRYFVPVVSSIELIYCIPRMRTWRLLHWLLWNQVKSVGRMRMLASVFRHGASYRYIERQFWQLEFQ